MKKEDCKVGTLVRARNGSSVGKIVEVNDETSTLSVAVVPLDRHDSAIWLKVFLKRLKPSWPRGKKRKNKTGSEQRPEKPL